MAQAAGSGETGAATAEQLTEAAEIIRPAAISMVRNTAAAQPNRVAPVPVIENTEAVIAAGAVVPVAVIVPGPVIANFVVPIGRMQPMFDVETALLGPLPKKSNPNFAIHPKV
ncbi:hypothetical protein M758_12G018900 [Ceratodon purpureus]|uniref:Uncharacterized protein n=1 Tax=Ceratodon purpureus TaxID=3225 RepID=A0A8T0G4Z0_CERPU|nr:hypothetical protein KC19_12G017500 [Ceratodon purpureus]KAG0597751.1 hypothetical protein M758_12G018900 [Ceratodon purpureus]